MSQAVAQWLVRATDDRVVAGSNPSDSVTVTEVSDRVAASKLGIGALGKFVYHTSLTSVVLCILT